MAENNNIHKDHRKRMMNKYVENGIDSFEKHEILEMLLFNVFPRCNTNDISHRLLREFRSLKGVLNANAADLVSVDGVGEYAAHRICFFGDFFRYLSMELSDPIVLDSDERVVELCREIVDVSATEFFVLFLLDKKRTLITRYFFKGQYNYVDPEIREIAAKAISPGCVYAIAVHSHPDEFLRPSSADITATANLRVFLKKLKVDLLDHLILTGDGHFSMRNSPICRNIWL